MTGAQLQNLSIIVGLLVSAISVFLLIRTNTRDNVRQRQADREKAIADAVAPLMQTITQLRVELRDEKARVNTLEDLLYRRGGTTT